MRFIRRDGALAILASTGQGPTPETVGMLIGADPHSRWRAVLQFFPKGYVALSAQPAADPDREIARMKASEERENADRLKGAGFTVHTQGWLEPPRVDRVAATSLAGHLFIVRSPGSPDRLELSYRGCKFGRKGYLSARFEDDAATAHQRKNLARVVLEAFEFGPGLRHADFVPDDSRATDLVGARKLPLYC